jgi:hypothetical protein
MTRPVRRLRYMLLFLLLVVTAAAGVNRIANPFGIWRSFTVDKSYLKEIKVPRVSMPYRLRREQPSTLIVGSSRALDGMPIEYGHRDGVLNASLPGATLDEIAFIIDVAIERSRPKRLIWGVDFYAFDENQAGFRDSETRLRLEGDTRLLIVEALLSMEAFELSRKLLGRAIAGQKGLPPERSAGALVGTGYSSIHRGSRKNRSGPQGQGRDHGESQDVDGSVLQLPVL